MCLHQFHCRGKNLNRPIIINPIKTSIQRINEVHTVQCTEAAAEPEYSRGESFGVYKRNSHISSVLNPSTSCTIPLSQLVGRQHLIQSPQGISTQSWHSSCHPSRSVLPSNDSSRLNQTDRSDKGQMAEACSPCAAFCRRYSASQICCTKKKA